MAKPNARSGNPPHSRRAGCELPYGAIPSHAAPAQRIPTSCLSYSMVSIPNPRSNSHCSSTSLAASPEALGSRWHYATRDQEILRIVDELETCRHTARSRRTLPRAIDPNQLPAIQHGQHSKPALKLTLLIYFRFCQPRGLGKYMVRSNARSGNSAHSRRAGDSPQACPIPPRTAPAQRIPTRCLPYSRASMPNPHSPSHSPSTSSATRRAGWGSRWQSPTQDQATLRIADELQMCCHTARARRALPKRNVFQAAARHTGGLAFQRRAHTPIAHLLPVLLAPRPGEVDGTIQGEVRKIGA